MAQDLVIGVDGGGTKTVAWLAPLAGDADRPPLGRGFAGPGNPRAVGFDAAQANIAAAIAAAFADAGLPPTKVASACFGLAGAGRAEEQQRIAAWAMSNDVAEQVRVVADAELVLAAGSPENWGIALIAGTGSLAWGRTKAGDVARSGGWGYLLGDEGSGYAIALAGLQAAVRAADGRGRATSLLASFQQALAVDSPEGLIDRVYSAEMNRKRLAGLAEVVFAAAPGDAVARGIVDRAANDLAEMVTALAQRLALPGGQFPLALAGGVLVHQAAFRERVVAILGQSGVKPASVTMVEEPVSGGVHLARQGIADSGTRFGPG